MITYGSAEGQTASISEYVVRVIGGRATTRASWMPRRYQAGLCCRTMKR